MTETLIAGVVLGLAGLYFLYPRRIRGWWRRVLLALLVVGSLAAGVLTAYAGPPLPYGHDGWFSGMATAAGWNGMTGTHYNEMHFRVYNMTWMTRDASGNWRWVSRTRVQWVEGPPRFSGYQRAVQLPRGYYGEGGSGAWMYGAGYKDNRW